MLQDTKEKKVFVVAEPEQAQFSEEFLSMVQDRAYETLRAYLEKTKQEMAVKLLDDLVILSMPRKETSLYIYNQIISEAIGGASQHVLALGGSFLNT
jgi:uncharacterized protein (DUF2164 family)